MSLQESCRPVFRTSYNVRQVAEAREFGNVRRPGQEYRTMLEDGTITAPLRTAYDFESLVDKVLRISVREAEERPLATGRLTLGGITPPIGP